MTVGAEMRRAIREYRTAAVRETEKFLDGLASETTREMKDTRPWTDRTHEARKALYMRADPVRGGHGFTTIELNLGYDAMNDPRGDHGFWLENTRHGARLSRETTAGRERRGRRMTGLRGGSGDWGDYAIVYPTMEKLRPLLGRELRRIWSSPPPGYRPRLRVLGAVAYDGMGAPASPATNIRGASGLPARARGFLR